MAADGRIVIDVILDDGSVVQGLADINGQFGDLDRNGNSKLAKIGGGMKNLAKMAAVGVAGVAGVVAAVGAMTGPLAQAAASANALSSQFEQVFGELESSATKGLNKIAEQTNILPERLKGSFTQMAAFAKTTGLDTAGALALTERATLAAADSAAFYDKSIEEVSESLQSFLKGNFENDAALGISATETTRNAKANELYGKSFIKLDEAQKQLTLLAMVEDGNKLSGALGQAAREGESLENVTGNLKQAWENLKAQLGQYVLQSTIDGIVLLTKVIQNFDITPFVNAFSTLKNLIAPIITSFVEEAKAIFGTLREYWSSNGQSIIDNLRSTFESIQEAVVPKVNEAFELIKNVISDVRAVWEQDGQAIIERLSSIFQSLKEIAVPIVEDAIGLIVSNFNKIKDFWETDGQQILQSISNVFQGILAVIEFIMPAVKFVIEYVWDAIKNIITGALDVIMGAIKIFSGLFTGDFSKMWEGVKQLCKGAIDLIIGWMSLTFIGGIRTLLMNLSKAGISIVKGMWDDIVKTFTSLGSKANGAVNSMVSSVVGFFKNLLTNARNIFGTMRTFGATTFEALKTAVLNSASKLLSGVKTSFTNMLNAVKTTMGTLKTSVSTLWDKVVAIFKPDALLQVGKDIVNGLIKGISSMFGSVRKKVESLAGLIPDWARSVLDIHSPSRVMDKIGKQTGEGLANGVASTKKLNENAINDLTQVITKVTKQNSQEVSKIAAEAEKERTKIQKDYATKRGNMKKADTKKIRQLESDMHAKLKEVNDKAWAEMVKKESELSKKRLEAIQQFIEGKKKLNELSLIDEAEYWRVAYKQFKTGSEEFVTLRQTYRDNVNRINDAVTSVNNEYLAKAQTINDNLIKGEQDLNQKYKDALESRYQTILGYYGLFDAVTKEDPVAKEELTANLQSQVNALADWANQLQTLRNKRVSSALIDDLEAMGPKALEQLRALNSMTDSELKTYQKLYQDKAKIARSTAIKELEPLQRETQSQISAMRNAANAELTQLNKDWQKAIKDVIGGTDKQFKTLHQVGKNAGQGLLDGLSSMQPALTNKAKSIAEAVKSTIQKALDIHSPSRWMRDFVAGNMAKGFTIGVDKNESALLKAAAQMGEYLKPDLNFVNPLRNVKLNLGLDKPSTSTSNISNVYNYGQRQADPPQMVVQSAPIILNGQKIADVIFEAVSVNQRNNIAIKSMVKGV